MSENIFKKQRYESNGNERHTFPLHPPHDKTAVLDTADDEATHIDQSYLHLDQIKSPQLHNLTSHYDTDPLRVFSRPNQLFQPNLYATNEGPQVHYPYHLSAPLQHPLYEPLSSSVSGDQARLPSPHSTSSATSPNPVLTATLPPPYVLYTQAPESQDRIVGVTFQSYEPRIVQTPPLEVKNSFSIIQKDPNPVLPHYHSPEYLKPPFMTEPRTFDGLYDPAMQSSSNLLGFAAPSTSSNIPIPEECFQYPETSPAQVTAGPFNALPSVSTDSTNNLILMQSRSLSSVAWSHRTDSLCDVAHQTGQGTCSHTVPLPYSPSNCVVPLTIRSENESLQYVPSNGSSRETDQGLRPHPVRHFSTIAECTSGLSPGSSQRPSAHDNNRAVNPYAGIPVSSPSLDWVVDHKLPESSVQPLRDPTITYGASADPSSSVLTGVNQSEDSPSVPLSECFRNPGQTRLRQRLDECLRSRWLRNNEEEPTPMVGHKERSVLLDFTSRSGRAAPFLCLFDGCGKKSDRKDRAIVHIRFRHLGHNPFPCGGRCGDHRCAERFACDSYRQGHIKKPKSPCENCGRVLHRKNMSRHRVKCQTPAAPTTGHQA